MAWLTGYNWRKQITIAHTADGAQTNYQMVLTVEKAAGADSAGNVHLNSHALSWTGTVPNDIRFTKSDGTTELHYWIESSDANTAQVWIEFDSIPAHPNDGTFYIYYGKASDTTTSNGDTTFIFHDDFPGVAIDGTKWTITANFGTVANSVLTLVGNGSAWRNLDSKITLGQATGALRMYAKIGATGTDFGMGLDTYSTEAHRAIMGGATVLLYSKDGTTQSSVATNYTIGTSKFWDILVRGGTNSRFFENGIELTGSPKTTNPPNSTTLGVGADLYTNAKYLYIDWALLRNYTLNEPTWGTWGSPEIAGAATLSGIGTLVGIGSFWRYGKATLAGTGTVAGIGRGIFIGKGTLSGAGTLAGIARLTAIGKATLSGTGALAVIGGFWRYASATLSGIGTLAGIGRLTAIGKATLSGVGSLSASAISILIGKATLVGAGTLAGIGRLIAIGKTTLSGVGTLASIGRLIAIGKATLSGTGLLQALGGLLCIAKATLSGTGSLKVLGGLFQYAKATLSGLGTLAVLYTVRSFRKILSFTGRDVKDFSGRDVKDFTGRSIQDASGREIKDDTFREIK